MKKFSDMLVTKKESVPRTSILNISEYPHIKDSELFRILRQLPKMTKEGPWVAGGAVWRTINNEPLDKCDIDIFFQNQKQFEEFAIKMAGIPLVNNVIKEIKNKWNTIYKYHIHEKKAFDKTYDIQFINMNFHPNIESLFDSFDFTVCQFAYDGENLHCGLTALEDLAAKRIKIYNMARPKSLFKHLYKYLSNGFTISSEQTRDLSSRIIGMHCWKKTDGPDYDDEENKKEVAEKYVSPFDHSTWESYGYTGVVSTSAVSTTEPAPIVEQENEIEDVPYASRPNRRNRQREGGEIGGRRMNRIVANADPFQRNAAWGQAGISANQWSTYAVNTGVAQWGPLHADPLPAAAANQPQAVIQEAGPQELFQIPDNPAPAINVAANELRPMNEPVGNIFHVDPPAEPMVQEDQYDPIDEGIDDDWEGFDYAQRLAAMADQNPEQVPILPLANPIRDVVPVINNDENRRENAIRQMAPEFGGEEIARRVLDQLEREGFHQVPDGVNEEQHLERAADRAEELTFQYQNEARNEVIMNNAVRGAEDVRRQAYNNAAEALNDAFRNAPVVVAQQQPANPPAERADENEIADNAAQQAERNELRDVFDDFFNA